MLETLFSIIEWNSLASHAKTNQDLNTNQFLKKSSRLGNRNMTLA